MERVGADLGFDPRVAQGCERLVAPVDPDDVRLPAVPVSLVGGRKLDATPETLSVGGGESLSLFEELLEESPQLPAT